MNSLANQYPSIAAEWDEDKNAPLTPKDFGPSSNKTVWWRCDKGHIWANTISFRTTHVEIGCPYCNCRKLIRGFNDLVTLRPDLAKEWDNVANGELDPSDFLPNSCKKVGWICERGHHWDAKICDRVDGAVCTICSGKRIVAGINDFATVYPDLCENWDYDCKDNPDPTTIASKSSRKVQWKCSVCGFVWKERVADRVNRRKPCARCSGKVLNPGVNDLASLFPDIASEWDRSANGALAPEQVKYNSRESVHWKCSEGHTWTARIFDRTRDNTRCPYCAGMRVIPGKNDLQSQYPEIADQWCFERNGELTPDKVFAKSGRKVYWKCQQCGQEWRTSVNTRVTKHTGCPYCAGVKAIPGITDFATLYPDLLDEWDYESNIIDPSEITGKSNRKINWCCEKGHKWTATVKSRTQMHSGCPYCAGKLPIIGETDLASCCPYLKEEWDYDKNESIPEKYTVHSGQKVWWKCSKGHSWKAAIYYRAENHRGCPICRYEKNKT